MEVWEMTKEKHTQIHKFRAYQRFICDIRNFGGDLVVIGSYDGYIKLIDLIGGKVLKKLMIGAAIYGMVAIS